MFTYYPPTEPTPGVKREALPMSVSGLQAGRDRELKALGHEGTETETRGWRLTQGD